VMDLSVKHYLNATTAAARMSFCLDLFLPRLTLLLCYFVDSRAPPPATSRWCAYHCLNAECYALNVCSLIEYFTRGMRCNLWEKMVSSTCLSRRLMETEYRCIVCEFQTSGPVTWKLCRLNLGPRDQHSSPKDLFIYRLKFLLSL